MNKELEKALAEFEHWSYTRTTAPRERARQHIRDLFAQTVSREKVREMLIEAQHKFLDHIRFHGWNPDPMPCNEHEIADQLLADELTEERQT